MSSLILSFSVYLSTIISFLYDCKVTKKYSDPQSPDVGILLQYHFALQSSTTTVGHLDTYGFTDVMISTVEYHDFVLLRTAEELFLRAFADTFNQNIIFLAYTTAIGYSRLFSLQVD